MKFKLFISAFLLLLLVAWIEINHKTFPPPPSNYSEISKTVNLKFKVINKDMNSIEMALNEGQGPNNLYALFEMSDDWYKGNFGLTLKGMSENSLFRGKSGKQPDIEKFEKDNKGNKVTFYSFDQTLVNDNNGVSFMQMSYVGSPMPLIQSLKIENNITLPRNISARFVNNESIEFLAGEYGIDLKINGFWIPVKLNGN